ncbi:MAG: flavodoxin-dependent (E)-4-hydroxy-3-methylbut-2-enyl-diphosphate synthase [Oscillospiraceae bacterium]
MRRIAREVRIGNIAVGGQNPVAVQSMLSRPAHDIQANVEQAVQLQQAGCAVLRVSVPKIENVALITEIKKAIIIPLVADIHFDYRIALASLEAGIDKIRINPGNIGSAEKVKIVADACKARHVPIRIGVNGGSLEKDLLVQYGGPTAEALVESAMKHVQMLEEVEFTDIIISIKSSNVPTMIEAYSLLAQRCAYPLHLGVTEAGTFRAGLVKNAMGIGALLMQGIGDTLRVSLSADPVEEVLAGYDILRAAGLPARGAEVISCPTCGRTNIDVAGMAEEVERRLIHLNKPLKVAVMGCVVNGIGEGHEADIGIAGGIDSAVLFVKGERIKTLRGDIVGQLLEEIEARGLIDTTE